MMDVLIPVAERLNELADDTLNRVARRLHEEGAISDAAPAQYCYIVARYVFLESLRRPEHNRVTRAPLDFQAHPEMEAADLPLERLDRCLAELPDGDRELILEYYRGEQGQAAGRRALAIRFAMTPNALTIRACRIRAKLEQCVSACSAGE